MNRWWRLPVTGLIMAGLFAGSLAGAPPAVAAPWAAPEPQRSKSVKVRDVSPRERLRKAPANTKAAAPTWPGESTGTAGQLSPSKTTPVGQTPVRLRPSSGGTAGSGATVTMAGAELSEQLVGVGVVFSVDAQPKAGLDVELDYSGFAPAVGGDWASRLQLYQLPACALTTPDEQQCQTRTPVETSNDAAAQTLAAAVEVPAAGTASTAGTATVVLAAAAAATGTTGSFTATSLQASSTWSSGTSSGTFNWSMPLRVPPVPGGAAPDLTLSYSSGVADGKTASENAQASWVGEGFDLSSGFIERTYISCGDDKKDGNNSSTTGDLCFFTDEKKSNNQPWDNATLSFGSHSGELVRIGNTDQWRLQNDDGTRVAKLGGISDESWEVTTTDGTKYYFGKKTVNSIATNSRWMVPVAGNQSGEPGHATKFADSFASRAWRWNLDYVVSPTGDSMTYYYANETNYYKKNLSTKTKYDRGGYLTRIQYGERAGSEGTSPAAQVDFAVKERCIVGGKVTNCETATPSSTTTGNWPDVPVDAICASTSCSTALTSPTFFTRKRLAQISTKAKNTAGTYDPVDTWDLTQTWPSGSDTSSPAMWLGQIKQTGKGGTAIEMPALTFTPVVLDNRVATAGSGELFGKPRMSQITTETGGLIWVNYMPKDCTSSSLPTPETNTKRCFPSYFSETGATTPALQWFHKYVVDSVILQDTAQQTDPNPVNGLDITSQVVTKYSYTGGGAWRYNDSPLIKPKHRTWGDWRGYQTVTTVEGNSGYPQAVEETAYFRGMNGDRLNSGGGSKSVQVLGWNDDNELNGTVRRSRVLTGVGGTEITTTTSDPYLGPVTASDGRNKARALREGESRGTFTLADGSTRQTRTRTVAWDAYGQPLQVENAGDLSTPDDDTCTRNTYAVNATAWVLDKIAETSVMPALCSVAIDPAKVLSWTRNYFDGSSDLGVVGKGLQTRVAGLQDGASGREWVTTGVLTYDQYGRVLTTTDAVGATTTTAYTPATSSPLRSMSVTSDDPDGTGPNPKQTTTTTYDPRWGVIVKNVEPAGQTSESELDALGRVVKVWLPGRARTDSPSARYSYTLNSAGFNAVKTETLRFDGSYATSYELSDSLLRARQTQAEAPNGGRIVNDTRYNSRGQAVVTDRYYNAAEPALSLVQPVNAGDIPSSTRTRYDNQGRPTDVIFAAYGVEKWRTTTEYAGEKVKVTPPSGGTPTTTTSDAQGHVVERIDHLGADTSSPGVKTTFGYTPGAGLRAWVKDAAGNTWRYSYDMRGNTIRTEDPDKGISTSTYDVLGRVSTTTDARGQGVVYTYDKLGRITKTASLDGATLTTASYDNLADGSVKPGIQAASGRQIGTAQIVAATRSVDAAGRPTAQTVTVPAVTGLISSQLAGTYTTTTSYHPDGSVKTVQLPAMGGLAAETLTYGYTSRGDDYTLTGSINGTSSTYVSSTRYRDLGGVSMLTLGSVTGKNAYVNYVRDDTTDRLTTIRVDRQGVTDTADIATYSYDNTGNITRIASDLPGSSDDTQCYRYDYQRQLTEAWTPGNGDCSATRTQASLGGPAPYWTSWTHDTIGRTTQRTSRTTTSQTTATFTYPANGQPKPHFVSGATITGSTGTTTTSYTFDDAGNTMTRPGSGGTQQLSWNSEGKLAKVTVAGATTAEMVYHADGSRVLRKQADTTTLTLGDTELEQTGAGAVTLRRYYSHAGQQVALRTGATPADVQTLVQDHQGTIRHQISHATGNLATTWTDPFGNPRGSNGTGWVGERTFVGGTKDATGLIHVGAREYDPNLNRFVSVDPIQNFDDPLSWNAYIYSNNSPVTFSDPTGEIMRMLADWGGGNWARSIARTIVKAFTFHAPTSPTRYTSRHDYTPPRHGPSPAPSGTAQSGPTNNPIANFVGGAVNGLVDSFADNVFMVGRGVGLLAQLTPWGKQVNEFVDGAEKQYHETTRNIALSMGLDPDSAAYGAGKITGEIASMAIPGGMAMKAASKLSKLGKLGKLEDIGDMANAVCRVNSFDEDTPVLMADGTLKPIAQVDYGDMVWATDPETGQAGPREVVDLIRHSGPHTMVQIQLADGTTLDATDKHPFWNPEKEAWVDAISLHPGDHVLDVNDHLPSVSRVTISERDLTAYNLTVDQLHTYYVGTTPTLVHNCGAKITQAGLDHSFDRHAAQWFGGQPTKSEKMPEWTNLITRAAGSKKVVPWSSGGRATNAHIARVEGKSFVAQFDRSSGDLVTAFVPGREQLSAMLRKLS